MTGEGEKGRSRSISRDAVPVGLENAIFSGRLMKSGSTVSWTVFLDWGERKTSLREYRGYGAPPFVAPPFQTVISKVPSAGRPELLSSISRGKGRPSWKTPWKPMRGSMNISAPQRGGKRKKLKSSKNDQPDP